MCKVRLAAIDGVIETLKDTESVELGHTDYYVFDTYIFPAFVKLLEDGDPIIQLKFIEVLPHLVNIGKMLIASVNMHKQKITMLAKDEQFEVEIDPVQREELLFSEIIDDPPKPTTKFTYEIKKIDEVSEGEGEGDTEDQEEGKTTQENPQAEPEQNHESEEEEKIVTTKLEAMKQLKIEKEIRDFAQSVLDDSSAMVSWSRKRF